jgi:hypothetical protein
VSWSRPETQTPRGDPSVATWVTWFIPGAGHVYAGFPYLGIAAFVVVQGLYFLGLHFSDGRGFEFLDADLRSAVAGLLTPEVGNLSALVYHVQHYGMNPPYPRPWPEHIHLGVWLTAISGILNACVMVHANFLARLPKSAPMPRGFVPASHVFAGWFVPGLGHWLQGRRARAIAVFLLLVGLFALGTLLAEGSNLDRERHFYYWSGQFLVGLPAMLAEIAHGHARVTHDIAYADAGLVFACLAGMLNILCLLDLQAYGDKKAFEALSARDETPPATQGATA